MEEEGGVYFICHTHRPLGYHTHRTLGYMTTCCVSNTTSNLPPPTSYTPSGERTANQEENKICKRCLYHIRQKRSQRLLEVPLLGKGTVLHLERDCAVDGPTTKKKQRVSTPPSPLRPPAPTCLLYTNIITHLHTHRPSSKSKPRPP